MTGIIESGTIRPALLVLGAAGDVGGGVVQAALEDGRRVVAVDADAAALQALAQRFAGDALTTLAAPVASDADAAALADRLRALAQPFDGVVASIAGKHPCGRLIDQPEDLLRRTLDEDLLPHLFAARHLFPLLPHDGAHGYVVVGGPGGDYPWAGYGHCSIAAAALRMMTRVLHDEAHRHGLRVQLLPLEAPVGTDANRTQAGRDWPKAVAVGRRALALLDAGRDLPAPARARTAPVRAGGARRPSATVDFVPAREMRDARSLLASLSSLPPPSPGILHDEAC